MSKKRVKASSDVQVSRIFNSEMQSTDEEDTLSNGPISAPISRKGTASSLSSKKSTEDKDMSSDYDEDGNNDDVNDEVDDEDHYRSDDSLRHGKSKRSIKIKLSLKQAERKVSRSSKKSDIDDRDRRSMEHDGEDDTLDDKPVKKQKRKRQYSDSDCGESDRRKHSRKVKKAKLSDEMSEHREEDDKNDNNETNMEEGDKKGDRKRKREESSDAEYGNTSSQQATESENSMDSFDSSKKKKKKVRPVIPGERKSSRARKGNVVMRELTDREFEKMLEEEEEESEKKKKGKRGKKDPHSKSSKSKSIGETGNAEKPNRRLNRSEKKDKEDGSGNDSDHLWYCELCRDGGDLLLCDTCPKSFHKECLKLEIVPDGEWSCPVCTGDGLPEKAGNSSEEEDNHQTFCKFCKDGGDVILCDFCPLVFHMKCLNPPLKSLPDGDWKCPICVIKTNPPKAKVKQVLTWRWKNRPKDTDELDHTHSPQKQITGADSGDGSIKKRPVRNERELFVKYEYHSYWDCSWITETELEVFQPTTHNNFKRKFDQNEPPALEDGSSFGRPRHKNTSSEDDPHNLEERFYRYGIKPEWLQIHRIITHDGKNKDRRYLVKWRDLPYSECTWEFPAELPKGLEDFDKYVEAYWTRRKQKLAKDEKKIDPPKKSLLRKKLERQPLHFDECGGSLHPYQLEGLNWLRFSWSQGTNTILADEMGLGKTIQGIAFLYSLYKEGYVTNKPFLVTAPLSTVPNWEREFEFWAPELYVVTYTGGKENRIVIREQEFSYKEGAFLSTTKPCKLKEGHRPKFDVLLTSYEYIHNDFATLSSIEWGVLIIDEAHRLKNNQSLFFRTMADYKINYKLLLTGTPLQNNLEELFNLLHFLEPDKFVNMDEFLNEFSEISKDEQVLKLHEMLAPHMLRRMKMDVLKDIPSKSEFIVRIELSAMQKKYYRHILTKNYEALNAKGYSNQTSLINIMMDLRKCCNHPYLFPGAEKDAPLTARGMYEGISMTKASGKLELLDKMLRRLKRDGHRVLIFSQMTRMLDILEDFLTAFNYGYERIDGSIAGTKRQECIDRFNSPDSNNFVFLLSTRAGGLGINLATADTVIIYDMDWNPHNDIQAFSRAHRIGQKNKVMIYRFVTRNTVEEKIAQVCKQKMMLSELIVHRGMGGSVQSNEKTDSLTKQEISDILKYGAENLFRDDEEGQVVYNDEAIEILLDRSIENEGEKEKEFGMNEYLRSFKVASYQVKEGVDDDEENEEKDDKEDDASQATDDRGEMETDIQYWQRVLGPAYNEHMIQTLKEQEELANKLGKGKRVRKHINYAEKEMMDAAEALSKARKRVMLEEDLTFQSDYEPSSSSDEEAGSGRDEDGSESGKKKKTQNKGPPPPLPPLVDRVEGQVLVLGFTARQRRAFLDAVMRYGMPPDDPYRSQWLVRDLRGKSERIFKSYVSLFMRHLCEPISDNSDKFADGVPREGLSRQHVLTRIGIIALIRKKVHEFEHVNGADSMLEFRQPKPGSLEDSKLPDSDQPGSKDTNSDSKPIEDAQAVEKKKDEDVDVKEEEPMDVDPPTALGDRDEGINENKVDAKEVSDKQPDANADKEKEVAVENSENTQNIENADKIQNLSDSNQKVQEDGKTQDGRELQASAAASSAASFVASLANPVIQAAAAAASTTSIVDSSAVVTISDKTEYVLLTSLHTPAEIASALRKRLWIADGGFTELHSLWELEEQQLVNKKEYETWHRRHDFWLLTGVITHGYRHWQDILSDPRFDVLNQAFRSDSERARKAAFLNRRFQLLEQAMVIEEQLRKALAENVLNNEQSVNINSTETSQALQRLQLIDDLAAALRSVNTESKSSKSVKLQKVLNQVSALVNDINDMSYINMPASLAKPYAAAVVRTQVPPIIPKLQNMKPMAPPMSTGWSTGLRGSPTPSSLSGMQPSKTSVYGHINQSGSSRMSIQSSVPVTNKANKSPNNDKSKDVICID